MLDYSLLLLQEEEAEEEMGEISLSVEKDGGKRRQTRREGDEAKAETAALQASLGKAVSSLARKDALSDAAHGHGERGDEESQFPLQHPPVAEEKSGKGVVRRIEAVMKKEEQRRREAETCFRRVESSESALLTSLQKSRRLAEFAGSVPLRSQPILAEESTSFVRSGANDFLALDRVCERDARRYDRGFTML